jgi:paraquat-inducible protein B
MQKNLTNLPHARVKRRAALSMIWAVPAIAAVVAVVLVVQNLQKYGTMITLQFNNANGLDANQTVVRYRGIRIGSVKSIQLTKDLQHVEIRARLERSANGIACDGTVFWIVRPEVGTAGVHALETIVSGPYIEVLPPASPGKFQDHFIGTDEAPVVQERRNGVEFVLHAPQIRSIGADSPVYFRGLQAGKVLYMELSEDSKVVNIHVLLKPNFAPLIHLNTVWWNAGGFDVNWHLLSGLNMSAENLKALLTGGIGFATPDDSEGAAPAGTEFTMYERPDEKWLAWAPYMEVTNSTAQGPGTTPTPASIDLQNVSQPSKQQ